ncbi:MAG TPA: hypothetical protein VKQ29_08705 [Aliidongia sp.]|nr:hypothetical protein [Aliidongia sp.]
MVQSSSKRSDMPRTLFKIILMLGLALAGVAAIAAEPEPAETANPAATCAASAFDFGGRIIENGEVTDTWTLTCWRQPGQQGTPTASATAKPVDAVPVASQSVRPAGDVQGPQRF